MNCKDCKHWHEETREQYWTPMGYGTCYHPKLNPEEGKVSDKDGGELDEGHDGHVYFGPMFGCIHFEPKP
jgi:hypothetical protein